MQPSSYLQPTGIELLSAEGQILSVPYHEIKSVVFVRDFDASVDDERRTFLTRPKMEGLWVRFKLRDGDVLEGVMPNNLLQVEHYGFAAIPPDPYGPHQRIFIPRTSLISVEVLGVVGSPLKRKPKAAAKDQIGLFDE